MVDIYFLDSYAIIEIIKNNKNFEKFKDSSNFTGIMNILEVHYYISKDFNEKKADLVTEKLNGMIAEFNIEDVKLASRFRIKYIKRKLSYIDCLGYVMAQERNLKFVTGDKEFEDLSNVEFIK